MHYGNQLIDCRVIGTQTRLLWFSNSNEQGASNLRNWTVVPLDIFFLFFLWTGTTFANFQISRNKSCLKQSLNVTLTESHIISHFLIFIQLYNTTRMGHGRKMAWLLLCHYMQQIHKDNKRAASKENNDARYKQRGHKLQVMLATK